MRNVLLFIGLIITALFFAYCISNHSESVERDITARVQESVLAGNVTKDLNFAVDGRDVYMDGFVPSEQDIDKIVSNVQALEGVRVVNHNLRLLAPNSVAVFDAPDVSNDAFEPEDDLFSSVDANVNDNAPDLFEVEEIDEIVPSVEVAEEFSNLEEAAVVEEVVVEAPITSPIVDNNLDVEQIPSSIDEPVIAVEEEIVVLADVDACQSKILALIEGEKINFDSGSAVVKPSSYGLLNNIVNAMKDCDDVGLRVHGYTDSSGEAIANRTLSHNRAKSVGLYLLNNGVAQKVRVVGHGANDSIDNNETPEGRAKNRRIEFEVVPASEIPNE